MDISNQNIAVIGLGLIGGSICKTIKKHTGKCCFAMDINTQTLQNALQDQVIAAGITPDELKNCDIVIVALHPKQTIRFILDHAPLFKKGSIVMDVCGIKTAVVEQVTVPLKEQGVHFVGAHPMAGREFSGYEYALDHLFDRASMIITPTEQTSAEAVKEVAALAEIMHFKKVVISSPERHDQIIAFTSQLAHVVSNAYIKSPSSQYYDGFSAGSFLDLTRVAKLNENMWTDLFMMNKDPLLFEIDTIIDHLCEYRDALRRNDDDALRQLLKDGRELKEKSLEILNQS